MILSTHTSFSYDRLDSVSTASSQLPSLFVPTKSRSAIQNNVQPAALRSRYVKINFNLLGIEEIHQVQQFSLPLFDDVIYTAQRDRVQRNPSGSYTWIGHLNQDSLSLVVLVINDDKVVGSISTVQGNFDIRHVSSDDGLHTLNQIDDGFYMQNEQDTVPRSQVNTSQVNPSQVNPSQVNLPLANRLTTRSTRAGADAGFDHPPDDGSVIDVMVVYTDDFARLPYVNGSEGAQTIIELYVAYTNEVMARSNVNTRLALVHVQEVLFEESSDSGFTGLNHDLKALETGEKGLDIVHELRDTYHADQVTMLVSRGSGGLAFIPDTATSDESSAVAILGCLSPCQHLYAHEVGHNLGATHDWYNSGPDDMLESYAHGHVDATHNFRTIMAYNHVCEALQIGSCPQIPYYSNPELTYNNGPMGVPDGTDEGCRKYDAGRYLCDSDVTRVINERAAVTALYRNSQIVWTGSADQDWHNSDNWEMFEGSLDSSIQDKVQVHHTPRSMDDVYIPASPTGRRFPILSTDGEARNVTIEEGALMQLSDGVLSIYGHWEDHGTVTATGGKAVFMSHLRQTIESGSDSAFYDLQIGDDTMQQVYLKSNLQVKGNLIFNAGPSFKPTSHTIRVAGDWIDLGSSFDPQTSTVVLDGADQVFRKATSSVLLSESFEEYDVLDVGSNVTEPPQSWLVTNETENGKQWEFTPRQWAPNRSSNGHARRWQNSAAGRPIDTWLFTRALELYPGYQYQLTFDYGSLRPDCPGDNLYVALGQGQSAKAMTTRLNSYINIRNTTWQTTSPIRFTVPTQALYHLGFQNQNDDGVWPCSVALDDIQVLVSADHFFHNLVIESQEAMMLDRDIHVQNDLTIEAEGLLDLGESNIFVDGDVTNRGTLQQTRNLGVDNSPPYDFLTIQNSQEQTAYYGVQITPERNDAMGLTTVQIKGQQDCSLDTDDGMVLDRCFEIIPTNDSTSATLRLWYTEAERNGQQADALNLLHTAGSTWQDVGENPRAGVTGSSCTSDSVCWFQVSGVTEFGLLAGGSGNASDMTIRLAAVPEDVAAGDTILHTFTYHNLGPDRATDVQIVYTPPINLLSIESEFGSANSGSYSWNIGDVEADEGGSVQAIVVLHTDVPDEVVSGFTNISASNDTNLSNNVDSVTFNLIEAATATPTAMPTATPTATPISVTPTAPFRTPTRTPSRTSTSTPLPTSISTVFPTENLTDSVMPAHQISFQEGYYKVDEDAGVATITVVLSPVNFASETTVFYRTGNTLATENQDFSPTAGRLTIPAGVSKATFTVPILDDAIIEPNKLVDLFLEDPQGAVLGELSDALINIIDDDYVDLIIEQKVAPAIVQPSKVVIYTLEFQNLGNAIAEDVTIIDRVTSVLSELSYRSNSPVRLRLDSSEAPYVWHIDRLGPNESGQIIIAGRLNTLSPGTKIFNTVTITGAYDAVPENNMDDSGSFTVLNIAPLATNDSIETTEETPVRIPVLINDSDGNGERLSIASVTDPANGQAVLEGQTIFYTPDQDFFGVDTFEYTVEDSAMRASATVIVTVNGVNDPPQARTDVFSMDEDEKLMIPVLENDIEVDGDTLYLQSITAGRNGKASIDGDVVSYEPLSDFNGSVVMTYTVIDGDTPDALSANGTISLTIRPVNDPPHAEDDTMTIIPSISDGIISVLDNDYDVDGDPLTIHLLEENGPNHGRLTQDGTAITYEAEPGFVGSDTFSYKVTDGPDADGLSDTATVYIEVLPSAEQGDALMPGQTNWVTTSEDISITIDILQDNMPGASIRSVDQATYGATMITERSIVYTPHKNFNGVDSFVYTIQGVTEGADPSLNVGDDGTLSIPLTVSVLSVNDRPTFTRGRNQMVPYDPALQSVPSWATNMRPGPSDEGDQTLRFVVEASQPTFFSEQPTVDVQTGILSYRIAEGTRGITFVSITLVDDGGTENGGMDQSEPAHMTITILEPANTISTDSRTVYDPAELFSSDAPAPEEITSESAAEVRLAIDAQVQPSAPGETASFVIDYENEGDETLEGTVMKATVPESATFSSNGSGLDSINAAGQRASLPEGGPIFGQTWELPDGSGPCPEGHPAGKVCVFRLGTLDATESGLLRFNVVADETMGRDTILVLDATLRAADLNNHRLIDLNESSVEAGVNSRNALYLPVIVK